MVRRGVLKMGSDVEVGVGERRERSTYMSEGEIGCGCVVEKQKVVGGREGKVSAGVGGGGEYLARGGGAGLD